mmetsp:Transcript_59215/g.125866  ORF Transcript_59215/g.125866 Transcript_59215/m.125866 type:complete len:239 (+) Transcript_59215:517-1233(+)
MVCQISRRDPLPIRVSEFVAIEDVENCAGPHLLRFLPVDAVLHDPQGIHARAAPADDVGLQGIPDHDRPTPVPALAQGDVVHLAEGLADSLHVPPRPLLRHVAHGMTVRRPHKPLVRVADRARHGRQSLVRPNLVRVGHEHGQLSSRGHGHAIFHDPPVIGFIVLLGNYRRAVVDCKCPPGHDQVSFFDTTQRPTCGGAISLVLVSAAEYEYVLFLSLYQTGEHIPILTALGIAFILQ